MRIFVSYRRRGETGYVARLADRLARAEGVTAVFRDADALRPAVNFQTEILTELERADVLIAAIGNGWAGRRFLFGTRLQDAQDWVRRELEHALGRGIPIVPVLIGDAVLPEARRLPPSLRGMLSIQVARLRDESWEADLQALLAALQRIEPGAQTTRQWPEPEARGGAGGSRVALATAGALGLVAVGALALWRPWVPDTAGPLTVAPRVTDDPAQWTAPPDTAARSRTAALALRLALTEMQAATREARGQNDGFNVSKFTARFAASGQPLPWSVAFVGWCYLDALRRHRNDGSAELPFPDSPSASGLRRGLQALGWILEPFDIAAARPGDIVFFDRGRGMGHAEIVFGVIDGKLCSIGGNVDNRVAGQCRDPAAGGLPIVALGAIPAEALD